MKVLRFLFILFFIVAVSFASSIDKGPAGTWSDEFNTQILDVNPDLQQLVSMVSYDSLYNILFFLEEQGVRAAGGVDNNFTLNMVRDWIIDKLDCYQYTATMQDVYYNSTYYGQNIIIEKTGNVYPDTKIVVGAHYDSVPMGPGINDNGSGAAALLELARIISTVETDYSVIMVWFTAEELGFYGSAAYIQQAVDEEMDIILMFNMDMIGGINRDEDGNPYQMTTITCEQDERMGIPENNAASHAYTDTLSLMTTTYSTLQTFISNAYGSDYIPFEQQGYVITGYYEYLTVDNPYYHTSEDILTNMNVDYLTEVTKGAVAFTAHIARFSLLNNVFSEYMPQTSLLLTAYPNPFNSQSTLSYRLNKPGNIQLRIYDNMGRELLIFKEGFKPAGEFYLQWNADFYPSGIYYLSLQHDDQFSETIKLMLIK